MFCSAGQPDPQPHQCSSSSPPIPPLMGSPSRPLLMSTPSAKRSPWALVSLARSDPARSTRCSLLERTPKSRLPPAATPVLGDWTRFRVRMAWDREECSFRSAVLQQSEVSGRRQHGVRHGSSNSWIPRKAVRDTNGGALLLPGSSHTGACCLTVRPNCPVLVPKLETRHQVIVRADLNLPGVLYVDRLVCRLLRIGGHRKRRRGRSIGHSKGQEDRAGAEVGREQGGGRTGMAGATHEKGQAGRLV